MHDVGLHVMGGKELPPMYFSGAEEFDLSRLSPVVNRDFCKPEGGLWLSPIESSGATTWQVWCRENQYDRVGEHKRYIPLRRDARLLVIDSLEDLEAVCSRWRLTGGSFLYEATTILDFEAMAKEYDGTYLTDRGQWSTRHTDPNLYGWDLESALVFHPEALELH